MPSHSMASEHHQPLHSFCIFSREQGALPARTASTVVPTCDSRVELPGTAPATVNRALLGSLTASYIDAPGGARVTAATPETCCSLLVPLEGRVGVHTSEGDAEATPAAPYLRAPTREAQLSTQSARFLLLDLPAERIAAAAATGRTAAHHASVTGEEAACLLRLTQKLAAAADRFPGLATLQQLATAQRQALTPKPVLQLEDQLIKQVAAATTADVPQGPPPPSHLRDAPQLMAWLGTSPQLPATVRELARLAGMSMAVLQREFRKIGHSPRVFLHDLRLDRARAALVAPTPETTVADVAHACGMAHLGRFSQYYRERFGELPSDTLRRSLSQGTADKPGGVATTDAQRS